MRRRSTVRANCSAASPKTRTSATPKSRAKLAKFDVTMRPPVDIMVIITNISQKIGVFSILAGATLFPRACDAAGARISSGRGSRRPSAARTPTPPRMRPNTTKVLGAPEAASIEEIGNVVSMAPIP